MPSTSGHRPHLRSGRWSCMLAIVSCCLAVGLAATPPVPPPQPAHFSPEISPGDLRRHITYLASESLEGRLTGTTGERLATDYVAMLFQAWGLLSAGDRGTYVQNFEFTAGVSLGPGNQLTARQNPELQAQAHHLNRDWRPLAFSKVGLFPQAPVVFAGYGLVAPATDGGEAYDAYAGLDVVDKWVLVLRYLPEDITPERRQHLASFANLRYKGMVARDRGALGLIVVSGPNAQVKEPLVELSLDTALLGTNLAALSVTDAVAGDWLNRSGHDLKAIQDRLDSGSPLPGFLLGDLTLAATIDIAHEKRLGRNVLARLPAGDQPSGSLVIIGAHVDHLGHGGGTTSLAHSDERGRVHVGADDNASGVGALLEVAHVLADLRARGQLPLQRDILFAAWSGEELGLLGSSHFLRHIAERPHAGTSPALQMAAYLNMDMIGRLEKALTLYGVGSSSIWRVEIARANAGIGLPLSLQDDSYVPSDATAFYVQGVPVLSAFTGAHADYHTPRDTADKINYAGTEQIARLLAGLTAALALRPDLPDYRAMAQPERSARRAGVRVSLGTIPDYSQAELNGLKVAGVVTGGPAEQAGVLGGDVIVELAGRRIDNIYDYTYTLNAAKGGVPLTLVVLRAQKRLTLTVTPVSRE